MKTTRLLAALSGFAVLVVAGRAAGLASAAPGAISAHVMEASIDRPGEVAVGDRYLVPELPPSLVRQLPASEVSGDRYLAERIALAELVISERILVAEDMANALALERPGFAAVLLTDGFRQDSIGTWYYDRYNTWLRFPLNR